jgi:hypothetical protein
VNNSINAIKRIDQQLKELARIEKSGNAVGAGLTIDLCVGNSESETAKWVEGIQLGITGMPEELLALLILSLSKSRQYWVNSAIRERDELKTFLEANP